MSIRSMSVGYLSDWHFPLIIAGNRNIMSQKRCCGRKKINEFMYDAVGSVSHLQNNRRHLEANHSIVKI